MPGAKPVVVLVETSKPAGAVTTIAPIGPIAFIVSACVTDGLPIVVVKLPKFIGEIESWAWVRGTPAITKMPI
jgi:hypothetical protein